MASKIVKLLNLMASDSDGEALNAARLATKFAEEFGGWEKVLAGAGSETSNEDLKKEYRRGYSAGYRAGVKKSEKGKAAVRPFYTPDPLKYRRPRPGNYIQNQRTIKKLVQDFYSIWDRLSGEEKILVMECVDYYNVNYCLHLKDYDNLKSIAKRYWDYVYE